jgi:hypothetical protein
VNKLSLIKTFDQDINFDEDNDEEESDEDSIVNIDNTLSL